jgi:serine/threonine-protein kinase
MAEVYRATDESLGRKVAVKVLSERFAQDDDLHARFLREARTAASLSGEPHVIVIHDVGETRRTRLPFIVMELVRGGSVADRVRHGRVPVDQALEWLGQAADALDHAHERGIVHRDVKPANLLVADDGTIRVSDFGIARAAGNDTLTLTGTILGSSGYMAPEQARGEATTPASDRYALACVAFELLSGRRPFVRANPTAEAHAHATEEPPSPRAFDPSLPPAVDAVFARALAKRPDERYPTCAALVDDLRRTFEPATVATTPFTAATVAAPATPPPATAPAPPPAPPSVTRHVTRPRWPAAAVLGVGLLAAGAGLAWGLGALGGDPDGATVVVTRTAQGRTIERTVTESSTVTEQGGDENGDAAPPPQQQQTGESASTLNDRGFRLLQQGDPQAALPPLEAAVSALSGSGSTAEAYASYNLAWARFALGRCDGVAGLLERSEAIQGKRKEIDRLRKQVDHACRR